MSPAWVKNASVDHKIGRLHRAVVAATKIVVAAEAKYVERQVRAEGRDLLNDRMDMCVSVKETYDAPVIRIERERRETKNGTNKRRASLEPPLRGAGSAPVAPYQHGLS